MGLGKSLYINTHGPDRDAIKKGLRWLQNQSKLSKGGFIAVPGISNLDGIISDILGYKMIKNLKKGQIIMNGTKISLITERKLPHNVDYKPIFVLYADKYMLDKIDSIKNREDVLVCPWIFDDVKSWIDTRNATELGRTSEKKENTENPVVIQALQSLTNRVNISTGIAHPQDRSSAIWVFKILQQNHEKFSPDRIKSWLISEGNWKSTDAESVAEIARGVIGGRGFRAGICAWSDDVIDIWREEAKNKVR